MHHILIVLTIILDEIVVNNGSVNYCGAKMCGHGNTHTFCQYQAGPSPLCRGYMEAPLSSEEKTRILARLNRRRSEAALGLPRRPPAGDMLKLRWIEELSREAQRWADQCRAPRSPEENDVCRDLYSITVGQCVASVVGEAPGLRPESMVDMWYMQGKMYTGNITFYVSAQVKTSYEDFAQIMWSKTYMVGCGRSRFMAEWRGRLRSVERLVCNFAPRGPVPGRPIWTPAEPASMCPPRSKPDELPGLCTYQNDRTKSNDFRSSIPIQENYILDTVFEIEKNMSSDHLGKFDEIYLTKLVLDSLTTVKRNESLNYLFNKNPEKRDREKRDFEGNKFDFDSQDLWKVFNERKVDFVTNLTKQPEIKEYKVNTRTYRSKVNVVGRPKPYDVDELNDATAEHKAENSQIEDMQARMKEKDLYAEYGLIETDEDVVNTTTNTGVTTQTFQYENMSHALEVNPEKHIDRSDITNEINGLLASEKYINISNEDVIVSPTMDKNMEDYLSDPETAAALQNALDRMERTLAPSGPISTPGKVRRELRNLEADMQNQARRTPKHVNSASEMRSESERNRTKDRGPMISMVLKYLPYLKPYEKNIIGEASSGCHAVFYKLSIIILSSLFNVFVVKYSMNRTIL